MIQEEIANALAESARHHSTDSFDSSLAEEPEYATVEDFVEFLIEEERTFFTTLDLTALAFNEKRPSSVIRKELEGYGLEFKPRAPIKHVRGFGTNSHDRWHGPGSSATHGGSGHEQIAGWAGRKG